MPYELDWPMEAGYTAGDEYVKYAAVYDLLFSDLEDDADFYSSCAAASRGAGSAKSILEIGTGTGRLAERLLRAGHAITGVDVSAGMLERARSKLATFGASYRGVIADVRTMALGETFGLAIIPYGTVAHLLTDADRADAFRRIFEHLDPGGLLVFDDMPAWLGGASDSTRLELRRSGFDAEAGMPVRLLSNAMDVAGEPLTVRYDFIDWLDGANVKKRVVVRVIFRNIALEDELALLRRAGFDDVEVLGGFDGRAFDRSATFPGANTRLILRCRKPA